VRYGDGQGWSDAGVTLQPGESFRDCAKRGVAATTGLNVTVGSMLQAHVLYADDWTDRDPIARPFVLFEAHQGSGQAEPHGEVVDLRWFDTPPTKLRYEELGESF
jgi:ADP-ribose pyrophosphatase YjhB (NUDIX family)